MQDNPNHLSHPKALSKKKLVIITVEFFNNNFNNDNKWDMISTVDLTYRPTEAVGIDWKTRPRYFCLQGHSFSDQVSSLFIIRYLY